MPDTCGSALCRGRYPEPFQGSVSLCRGAARLSGLAPARLAPSAVNSQPWFFTHGGDAIHVRCSKKGSRLDAGIALAHLYVANEETFHFFREDQTTDLAGYTYFGSVIL